MATKTNRYGDVYATQATESVYSGPTSTIRLDLRGFTFSDRDGELYIEVPATEVDSSKATALVASLAIEDDAERDRLTDDILHLVYQRTSQLWLTSRIR